MNGLIRLALQTRVFPNLLMIGLLVAGLFSLQAITVKNFPEISTGTIQVTTVYPGAAPEDVSDAVIQPIENAIRSVRGVRKLTATAQQGVGSVSVALERGAEVDAVLDDIETAVDDITIFPDAAEEPRIVQVEPDELAIEFVLSGDLPRPMLKDLAQTVRDDLQDLPQVSQVSVRGVPADEIAIEVPGDVLRAYELGLRDIAGIVETGSLDLSGGTLVSGSERTQVRTVGERETGAGVGRIPLVTSETGGVVPLSDVATIDDGLAEDPTTASLNGDPAVFVTVYRVGNEQLLEVVEATRTYLSDELEPRLPDTVTLTTWRNEASNLDGRIQLLIKNAAIGATLILIILTLVLDVRIAAWVAAGIIISFVGTFALMQVFGVSINQLSLFGFILALGIVVDDAIVVGESVYAKRQENPDDGRKAALAGAQAVARPILFSVSTTILAFMPLLFLPGTSGSFISPVAAVVIMVLVLSLVESFLVLPQHLAHLRQGEPRRFSPRRVTQKMRRKVGGGLDRFAEKYVRRAVQFCVVQPLVIIIAAVGILVASFSLVTSGTTKFTFFPDIEGNFLTANVVLPEGTALPVTSRRAQEIADGLDRAAARLSDDIGVPQEEIVRATAISIGFGAAAGGPGGGGASTGANVARIEAQLQDSETRSFSAQTFSTYWREAVGEIPGARELTFSGSIVGVGADISLQIAASDDRVRARAVAAVREALAGREGVFAIRDSKASANEEIVVELNDEGRALGIPLATLASEVRAAVFGTVATEIQRNKEEVEVRVRLPETERATLADIGDYHISFQGNFVPLRSIADLSQQPAEATITRIDAEQVTTVEADTDPAVTTGGAETDHILTQVLPRIKQDYPDVSVTLGGEQEEQGQFGPALTRNFVLAMFAIYAVLALAFRSYLRPVILLLVVPFGFAGALAGHAMLGMNLTLLSMFGIIGLSGIIINGALLIVNQVIQNEESGSETPIVDAVIARFRPVLLTTLTTFFGIAPLILETSLQAQFLIPTAVSLGFGLLAGSVFVLFLVPALCAVYSWLFSNSDEGEPNVQSAIGPGTDKA